MLLVPLLIFSRSHLHSSLFHIFGNVQLSLIRLGHLHLQLLFGSNGGTQKTKDGSHLHLQLLFGVNGGSQLTKDGSHLHLHFSSSSLNGD